MTLFIFTVKAQKMAFFILRENDGAKLQLKML
jgi:hypothetical protein